MITITRYGCRHWAMYRQGDLLGVTLYNRGAMAVKAALEA